MTAAGGSLEDCHTNVFVFAELSGLKWKCFKRNFNHSVVESIEDDPVLCAYGDCLSQGLLCTWRRRPHGASDAVFNNPAPRVDSEKELWVFWYSQDEPTCINSFRDNGLIVDDSYESYDVGVNYETRVLFFKALHNVIERNLLKSGYIRFGNWFTQPLDMPAVDFERTLPQYVNAVNFHFFMHGESLVCVTINVQRQPTMLRLSTFHLQTSKCQPVILGPWSIRALLLPNQPLLRSSGAADSSKAAPRRGRKPTLEHLAPGAAPTPTLAEIQAVVTQQWADWKKFQALPLDDDEDEDDENEENMAPTRPSSSKSSTDQRNTSAFSMPSLPPVVPKMVLVEIDGVRMFYPSCFVGVLADEMVFERGKCRMTSGGHASSSGKFGDLNSSFHGEPTAGGICAEDHEVEEIFNVQAARPSTSTRRGAAGKKTIGPIATRHCRRSFEGVRASRRSFEDGCLSVLLSRRMDVEANVALPGNSAFIEAPSTLGGSSALAAVEDTRWNFFDYLRREYCYCKMCSSTNPAATEMENTNNLQTFSEPNRESYAFHRSPTVLESVTPDQSPTFVKELKALQSMTAVEPEKDSNFSSSSSDHTAEMRSMWSAGVAVGAEVIVSGRLELERGGILNEADIFKILPNNKNFNGGNVAPPPRTISPFTPITEISPEPSDESDGDGFLTTGKKHDPALHQRLKEFDYFYNPLKRDSIQPKSYHIAQKERRKAKQIGPPPSNVFLRHFSTSHNDANQQGAPSQSSTGTSSGSNAKSKSQKAEQTSILKSLLDDGSNSPSPTNQSGSRSCDSGLGMNDEFMQFYSSKSTNPQPSSSAHQKQTKRRKLFEMLKTVATGEEIAAINPVYPVSLGTLDAMQSTAELEEPSVTLVLNDELTNVIDAKNSVAKGGLVVGNFATSAFVDHFSDLSSDATNSRWGAFSMPENAMETQTELSRFHHLAMSLEAPAEDVVMSSSIVAASTSSQHQQNLATEQGEGENDQAQPMDTSDVVTDAMTAVTPPALLNQSADDYTAALDERDETERRQDHNSHQPSTSGEDEMEVDRRSGRNFSGNRKSPSNCSTLQNFTSYAAGESSSSSHYQPSLNSSNQMIPSVASDHMHILSPPASNERVEFMSLSNLGNSQQASLYSSLSAGPLMHDSLSIIYPTPPTPMQQFSPQNLVVNAAQLMAGTSAVMVSSEHHTHLQHTLTEPALLQKNADFSESGVSEAMVFPDKLVHFDQSLYNKENNFNEFPQSDLLSTNLLGGSKRRAEEPIVVSNDPQKLPAYKKPVGDSARRDKSNGGASSLLRSSAGAVSFFSHRNVNNSMMDTDRELAMRLENCEMKLNSTMNAGVYGSQPFLNGAMPAMMAGRSNANFQNYMMQQQSQNFMNSGIGGMGPGNLGVMQPQGNFQSMNDMNAMMMARGGMIPQNIRGNMMKQQQYMQQQMLNNQLQRIGMQQQSPNFVNNMGGMQMLQQFGNRQQSQQSLMMPGVVDPLGANVGIFGRQSQQQQQQQQLLAARQQQQLQGMAGNNMNNNFPLLPSQQQTFNRFGSPQLMNNVNNSVFGTANNSNMPMNRSTSALATEDGTPCGVYPPPFASPKSTGAPPFLQTPQRATSNSSAQQQQTTTDYHLSSVSSTTSSPMGVAGALATAANATDVNSSSHSSPRTAAADSKLLGTLNMDAVSNLLQQGRSFIIAILLQDTVLDLHFDSVFDACPICCCNANIRTYELGVYINASENVARCDEICAKQRQNPRFMPDYWSGFRVSDSDSSNKCNCGFSAVRHRYLCGGLSGLFPDDSLEACGVLPHSKFRNVVGGTRTSATGRVLWFNPSSPNDREFIDLLRHLSLGRDFSAIIRSSYDLGGSFSETSDKTSKVSLDGNLHSEYIISRVDSVEMDKIMNVVVESAISSEKDSELRRPSKLQKRPIYHNWGVQIANSVREPKDAEYIAMIREIQPLLDKAMQSARGGTPSQSLKKLEAPLTWRSFLLKTSKAHTQQQEDEICQVEPIPNIIAATDREPIMTSPQLVNMWEKLSLSPYDQTKDVLYLAAVPDSNVVVEKCRIFLEELSSVYTDCRFGYHARVNIKDTPRDGIIRLNYRSNSANMSINPNFLPDFDDQCLNDRKVAKSRLKGFIENFESEMLRFFLNHGGLFDRRAFHESVHRNKSQQGLTSLANSSDSISMPPPAVPIQSPNSVLSSVSGPSSANAAAMLQMASSISPNQRQQQISPATGPSSAPSASSIGPMLEELTPEGFHSGTPNPQQLQHQQQLQIQQQQRHEQDQAANEATLEKEVEETLSMDNPAYLPHMIVIYLVNPFSFGSDTHHPEFARFAIAELLRAFNSFLRKLDVRRKPQIQLEIVNLQSLYDYAAFCADPLHEDRQNVDLVENSNRDKMSARDCLRKIAFTVFSQSRFLLPEHTRGAMTKSMTRFGPASAFGDILDLMKQNPIPKLFKIQCSPFILAPTKSIGVFTSKDGTIMNPMHTHNSSSNSKLQLVSNEERILFVTYCLIGDEWLCAAVTDEQGRLLDNVLINLVVQPPTNIDNINTTFKYARQSQIFDSIQRLWQFIQSVLVMETRNWRLVIGRMGKIGHGEFKAWTETLSKRNLRAYNNGLKNRQPQQESRSELGGPNGCKACSLIPGYQEMPAILSACLVSTEPELHLRIFPSSVQSEGNSNSNLFTASASSMGGAFGSAGSSGSSSMKNSKSKSSPQGPSVAAALAVAYDPSVTHIMVFPTILNISFEQQVQSAEDDSDFDNFFNNDPVDDGVDVEGLMDMEFATRSDEDTTIDNQPMATGYYISTAPAADLPDWFWSACPSARRRSPVHLKNSLHIHTGNIQQSDEIATISNKNSAMESHHPLDSNATDEVLKYVLEKYNALSWMNVDFATGARLSCLPVHVQALLRLYKSVTAFYS